MTQYTDLKPDPTSDALSTAERGVLWLTCPCHFLTHMLILVFPAVTIPITRSLGMPLEDVVKLSFLMYLLYGLGALPVGYLTDRWQARKLLIAGVYAMGIGLLLAGLFANQRMMPFCLMLVGIGASVYHPAGMALISHTMRRRGHALAINGVWGNFGIVMAPLVTGVLTWLFSWQWAFIVLGAIGIVTAALIGLIRIDETPAAVRKDTFENKREYTKYFLILCVALISGGLAYRANTVLLPAFLELKTTFFSDLISSLDTFVSQGTATLAATTLTSVVFVMGIFGQLVGGRLADRYDLRYAYLAVHAASLPFVLAMAFTSNYVLVACAGMYAFFSLGMQPIENSLVAALTPARWRSTGFAIKFVLTFGVGSIAVYLVGIIKQHYSLEAVYIFLAGVVLVLVLSIIVLIIASRRIKDLHN